MRGVGHPTEGIMATSGEQVKVHEPEFCSRRAVVVCKNGAVACGNQYAAQMGLGKLMFV